MNVESPKADTLITQIEQLRKQLEVERALEVIRSFTLGMRSSAELQELVHLVSQELRKSGTNINGGVFITINDEINDTKVPIWGSGGAAAYTQRAEVPYLDNPIFLNLRHAIQNQRGLYIDNASHQQKVAFFAHLFKHEPWSNTPKEVQHNMLTLKGGYARSVFISEYTSLFILNNTGEPFSDLDNDILQSFGRVFEQSYRRFLDIFRLEQQTKEVKRLSEAKSRLYTNIAHEFRTPLTVIRGMADQIITEPELWTNEGVSMINRNANRLLDLVNQLLELRKLESGDVRLNNDQEDIIAYIRYLIASIEPLANQKEITLRFDTAIEHCLMDYDREKLQRVIINLVSNAIKYTPSKGTVIVSALECSGDTPYLQLVIADTGIGIATEDLPNIFNRFYQVDDSTTRTEEGFGIGLALVANLIKIMNGTIVVDSVVDQGTTFTLKLPITHNAQIREVSKEDFKSTNLTIEGATKLTLPDISEQSSNKPSLLLIEDNKDVVTYIVACLYNEYEIQVAYNGREGIDLAITNIPDLIISDVMMPEKDGFEVCKTLKTDKRTSHIPIVLLTAKADADSRISGLEFGADAYMAKPFDKTELKVRLQKLLELRQKLQQHYLSIAINSTKVKSENIQDQFMIELRSVVVQRMSNPKFSVNDLREVMSMSRSQLHRKISALTGVSPNKFIRVIRLEKGKELLTKPHNSISEVAFKSGFNDPGYFGRIFKKEYGITPVEWKEKYS